jgi:glycosyltransferase involved in cell wall biosynthesis
MDPMHTCGLDQRTIGESRRNQPPLRVLAMVEAYSVNGVAKPVLEFCREAACSALPRVEISLMTFVREQPDNGFLRAARAEGFPVDVIQESGRLDLSIIAKVRDGVRRRNPQVIWTNNTKSHFLIRASRLSHETKWVAFHHGYTSKNLLDRTYNQMDRWSHRGADRLVTVCGKFASDLAARGVQSDRIRVQHTPIRVADPVPAAVVQELRHRLCGDNGDTKILLTVGRLSKEKGHADLVRTVAELRKHAGLPAFRLVLVGDGPELHPLESQCASLDLGKVVYFAGHQDNVRPYYAASDIFCLPSHTEGSPNVLLEAMEAGIPIVATAVGGVPEMVTHDRHALLVGAMDAQGMTDATARLLTDPALRASLASAARAQLAAHSPKQYFQNITSIFLELVTRIS